MNFDMPNDEEHGAARRSDPETSHEAAESFNPSRLHEIIIETLAKARTGLTTHEIADACGIGYQTITPRMKTMCLKGWVYNTGEKRPWMGAVGSPATNRNSIVWQLTALRVASASVLPAGDAEGEEA